MEGRVGILARACIIRYARTLKAICDALASAAGIAEIVRSAAKLATLRVIGGGAVVG